MAVRVVTIQALLFVAAIAAVAADATGRSGGVQEMSRGSYKKKYGSYKYDKKNYYKHNKKNDNAKPYYPEYSKCVNAYPKLDNNGMGQTFEGLAGSDLNVGQGQSKFAGNGTLFVDDRNGPPAVMDPQQFAISADTGTVMSGTAKQVQWLAVCSFETPTYEVKESSGSGYYTSYQSHLFANALCSTTEVATVDAQGIGRNRHLVFTTTLTFKVDPADCGLEGVRINYNNIFNFESGGSIGGSSTGYVASPNFPTVATH